MIGNKIGKGSLRILAGLAVPFFIMAFLVVELMAPDYGRAAATRTVSNLNDSGAGSLRQAISDSMSGDIITFNVTGTIKLQSQLVISSDLTIQGPGEGNLTIDGQNQCRVFRVNGGNLTITDLTVSNGKAVGYAGLNGAGDGWGGGGGGGGGGGAGIGGGLLMLGGSVTVERVTFSNNNATGGAGGNGGFSSAHQGQSRPGGSGGGDYNNLNGGSGGSAGGAGGYGGNGGDFAGGGGGGGADGNGDWNGNWYGSGNGGNGGFGGGKGGNGGVAGGWNYYDTGGDGGNGGSGYGGAIFKNSGTLTITSCTFSGNSTAGGAGGSGGTTDWMPNFYGRPGSLGSSGYSSVYNRSGTVNTSNSTFDSPGDSTYGVPRITGLSPSFGRSGGSITITGTGFLSAANVLIGGVAAGSYTVNSDNQITAVVGSGATDGNVLVITPEGNATKGSFIYAEPPGKPTGVSALPGDMRAVISFTAPVDNGGRSITSYTVTATPGGMTATGQSSPITVTGLANYTAYTFTVKATNQLGTGLASDPSNSITPVVPFLQSLTLAGSIPTLTAGSVYDLDNLSLTGRDQHGQPFDLTGMNVTWNCAGTAGSIKNGHNLMTLGPGSGTVTAAIGAVTSNAVGFDVTDTAPFWPQGAGLTVSNLSGTGLTLTWPQANDDFGVTGYRIYQDGNLQSTVSGSATSYNVVGLTPGEGYTFTVEAGDSGGDWTIGPSLSVTTSYSQQPQLITAVISGQTLTLIYDEDLNTTSVPADSDFTVRVNGAPQAGPLTGINISGVSVTMSVYQAVYASDTLTLDYVPGANPIRDLAGNTAAELTNYPVYNGTADNTPPVWPQNASLTVSNLSGTGLTLSWPQATDNCAVTGYRIYQDSNWLATVSGSFYNYNIVGLVPGTSYTFGVEAIDAQGNWTPGPNITESTSASLAISTGSNTNGNLPSATVGMFYSLTLAASGGSSPYTWGAIGLPPDFTLDTVTGEVYGNPTGTGNYQFKIMVSDNIGSTASTYLSMSVNRPSGTGQHSIIPVSDVSYTGDSTPGIATMTVNSGVTGFKYFSVNITPVISHSGDEVTVFVQYRKGAQININASSADFDIVGTAKSGFNVRPGDVIKAFIVDSLTNSASSNPSPL